MAFIRKSSVFCVVFLSLYVFTQVKAFNQCTYDFQCTGFGQYCCDRKFPENNVCRSNCIDETCILDSDCAPGECCDSDDKCKSDCNEGLAGWIVGVIVISVMVTVVIPIAFVVFCCCCAAASARRPAHGGVVVTQPATTGTTVLATQQQQQLYPAQQGQPMYFQNHQPYPNQPPPYQPEATVYPPGTSGPQMAMPPQTDVKQY